MSFIRKMKKVLSNKKYRENPKPENLSQERLAALSVGAINSEQTCYYCDSLTTGEEVCEIKGNLENFYDITDHDSAIETLDWLFERGHRVYFDAIKAIYAGRGEGIDYSRFTEEDQANLMEYFMNMQGVLPLLMQEGYFSGNIFDLANVSIVAWDMGRFGIQVVASPRHADCILVTGPVSRNMLTALRKTYDAMPKPAFVIACGTCAVSGGLFRNNPECCGGVDSVLKPDLYVPGCPPHPATLLDALIRFLGRKIR